MRKLCLLIILIITVIQSYSQISVDSIKVNSENVDSLEIIVYTSLPTCYLVDSTTFFNQQDSLVVLSYYSEEFPQCDCSPCQRQDLFKIKKDSFKKVVFNSFIRNFINNNTSFTEYSLYANGILWLTSVDVIKIEEKSEVTVYPNLVKDELILTRNIGGAFDIKIYDINGNTLVEKKLHDSEVINISNLQIGLYFLAINHKTVYKFIKY